jgi:alpha-D-ribose 1-methylphosphonate 5-triphosphate synthase subunit PhnI
VISHSDNVQATGFVEHLKLPHYVDFQAELGLVRRLRAEFHEHQAAPVPADAWPAEESPADPGLALTEALA